MAHKSYLFWRSQLFKIVCTHTNNKKGDDQSWIFIFNVGLFKMRVKKIILDYI